MIYNFYLHLLTYFLIYSIQTAMTYNLQRAEIGVWLSGYAYCDKENYFTMNLTGPVAEFIVTDILYDRQTDLQGFIGILHSDSSIFVTFRGSSSILNWLDDIEVKQVTYVTFPECDCKVHYGFYRSATRIKTQTIHGIIQLKRLFPEYKIIITGHSYGSAVAELMSMELNAIDISSFLYTYGQPRVGNKQYAQFVNKRLPAIYRFTHNKDIVPHIPFVAKMDYYHSCGEIFQDETGELATCSDIHCEDPECADRYKLYETNTKDHMIYLNHSLDCEQ